VFTACTVTAGVLWLPVIGSGSAHASDFVRGEVNGDGSTDILDAVRIVLFLFASGPAIECDDSADVNDDGFVNISDATRHLMYLFRRGPAPPAPFPEPGPDPTPDALCCGDTCNPDLSGFWSGTFFPEGDGEYVVSFAVEDTADGTYIVNGMESLGNGIFGGEIVILEGTEDRLLAFRYDTAFDTVAGEFMLSAGGMLMENGSFATTSGTEGTFSMRRVPPGSFPTFGDGDHSIVFVDDDDSAAWGGRLRLSDGCCIEEGSLSLAPLDLESSRIQPWPHDEASEDNNLPGVYTGDLVDEQGYAVHFLGLLAADELLLHGLFTDSFGSRGVFLLVPVEPPSPP
jgi:hypothetical protein